MRGVAAADVRRWRARRWFLSTPAPDVRTAVAANPPLSCSKAAYLSLFARLESFDPEDLHELLFDARAVQIAGLWGIGSLLVPFEVTPAFHATQAFAWRARARRSKLDRRLLEQIDRRAVAVAEALAGGPHTEDEVAPAIAASRRPDDWEDWWLFDRLVCRGDVTALPSARALMSDELVYTWADGRAPGPAPEGAGYRFLSELALYYFRVAGPATRDDFAWWSGISRSAARKTVEDLAGIMDELDVEGERQALFMFEEDAADLRRRPTPSTQRAALLPWADPAMMSFRGGFASLADPRAGARLRLVGRRSRKGLGRSAQPILVGGAVVGGWEFNSKSKHIQVTFARELPDEQADAVRDEAERVQIFLVDVLAKLPHGRPPAARPLPTLYRSPTA